MPDTPDVMTSEHFFFFGLTQFQGGKSRLEVPMYKGNRITLSILYIAFSTLLLHFIHS